MSLIAIQLNAQAFIKRILGVHGYANRYLNMYLQYQFSLVVCLIHH